MAMRMQLAAVLVLPYHSSQAVRHLWLLLTAPVEQLQQ
jgi:hypothetical protein